MPDMTPILGVFVPGHPAPQGSKRLMTTKTGKAVAVESSSDRLKPWRADIRATIETLLGDRTPTEGAVSVHLVFVMPRPVSLLRGKPTPAATKRPDIDKLARAVLDAITSAGNVWRDDSQVTALVAQKRTAEPNERAGCRITVHATTGGAP